MEKTSSVALRRIVLRAEAEIKKAKEAFEPRKGLNGFTGSKKSQTETRGKSILSWFLQLTAIQERRNMSYSELGKDFFECVKEKNILFMLILCCQIWQSGKEIAIQISVY